MPTLFTRFTVLLVALAAALTSSSFAQPAFDAAQLKQLEGFERRILYHPRVYEASETAAFEQRGGKRLKFETDQGKQVAWLMAPTAEGKCEKLWVFCAGNASTALGFEALARSLHFQHDAFVLVDYPGYGACAGSPSPGAIRANVKTAVTAAAKAVKLDVDSLPEHVCVFGHSLGCAAAMMAVEDFKLRSAVLCAPFTSTREMAKEKFYIADEVPLQHVFDNRPGLKALAAAKGHAWIFHGDADEVIPIAMSKTLAGEFKDSISLSTVSRAGHNDLIRLAYDDLAKSMAEARK